MKKYLILAALSFPVLLSAQTVNNVTDPVINNQFGYLTQIPVKPANVIGSVYLNEDWKETTVKLKKETHGVFQLVAVKMKLDLKSNMMEFQTDKGIKMIGGANVESFFWKKDLPSEVETYLNCDKFSFGDTKLLGFALVISTGKKIALVQHKYLEFVTADYNVALDVGSKDQKYLKKDKFYLLKNNQLISANNKSVTKAMADKKQLVSQFKRDQKLNLKDQRDLASLISYYNSL
ncbi:MAG: hypothetical protein WKF87_16800 [Chryseolinea sp.]